MHCLRVRYVSEMTDFIYSLPRYKTGYIPHTFELFIPKCVYIFFILTDYVSKNLLYHISEHELLLHWKSCLVNTNDMIVFIVIYCTDFCRTTRNYSPYYTICNNSPESNDFTSCFSIQYPFATCKWIFFGKLFQVFFVDYLGVFYSRLFLVLYSASSHISSTEIQWTPFDL